MKYTVAMKLSGKVTLGKMNNVIWEYDLGFVDDRTMVCCKPLEFGTSVDNCKGLPEAIAANIFATPCSSRSNTVSN